MVAQQFDGRRYEKDLCPICFLPAPSIETAFSPHAYYGTCPRCGTVGVTFEAVADLKRDAALRRKAQWVNLNFLQSGTNRDFWTSLDFKGEQPNYISLSRVDDYPIPVKLNRWREHVILALAELPGSFEKRELTTENTTRIWYATVHDLEWLLSQLNDEQVVSFHAASADPGKGLGFIYLNYPFWQEVERIQSESRAGSTSVFVASWFSDVMDEPFYRGIQPALKEAGYDAIWLKNVEMVDKIDDRILAEIRKARFVVVDVTGQRQAVYFEAGFSMGLGIPVIWTCRSKDLKKACFDTRQYSHIAWTDPGDLSSKLLNRIKALNL